MCGVTKLEVTKVHAGDLESVTNTSDFTRTVLEHDPDRRHRCRE
jgi:hypothetical protein